MTDLLLMCGAAGPVVFILVFLVEGALRRDYRPWRHFVSQLALGDRGWLQATNFILCGTLSLCFALGVARTVDSVALPVLFAVFGAGLIASGIFPCDAGLGYPPGAPPTWPRSASRTGNRHNLAGALVFTSLSIASFVAATRSDSRVWSLYSMMTGALVLVLLVLSGALAARPSHGDASDPPIGVIQRLAIIIGWTWMAAFALRLALLRG